MDLRRRSPNPAVAVETLRYQVKLENAGPKNILEEIIWSKEVEVDKMREKLPLAELKKQMLDAPPTIDFLAALKAQKTTPAVIAEVKKASPSKGVIREDFDPVAIARGYETGGATCLSVLTDKPFFQGSFEYLQQIRSAVALPLLCKDFIIYAYQMYWARLQGADAILLIAAVLSDQDLQYFLKIARTLSLTALVEVHDLIELDRVLALDGLALVGINNRDLTTFEVSVQTTQDLLAARGAQMQARGIVVVSESGLYTPIDLQTVATAGAQAVLVGESLMRAADPGQALAELIAAS